MKSTTLSPTEIFGNQIRYVVPLYQRPYVWTESEQWQPLWDDVRTLAERVLGHVGGYGVPPVAPHFLGAVVLDQVLDAVNLIGSRAVIDGQQRFTTLQLLLDAAQLVVARHGQPMDAESMRVLIMNNPAMVNNPDHVFKVWPTNRDQSAFRAAMDDDLVPDATQATTGIAKAHAFFERTVEAWATEEAERSTEDRLSALAEALRQHLRLVVIDLEPGDNAQVIFETLNHRGAPLLAADLIKNLLFQVAAAQELDVEALYEKYWRELDDDYWRTQVSQGRRLRPRIDVFMHRWLVMNLLRDVPIDRVFTEFRDSVVVASGDITALFAQIAADAAVHKSWESLPESSVAGLFQYRVLKALDLQVMAPAFLWLTRHHEVTVPTSERDGALAALESWIVRRALVKATTKDYNNVALDVLRALVQGGPESAGSAVRAVLASQSADSRYWPDDAAVAGSLTGDQIYLTITRPRLRMLLEALEDDAQGPLGEGKVAPRGLTIEHVMPVAWREHWGADVADDPAAAQRRDELVQTLGNLTLVNGKLNPTLSNRPWTDAEAIERGLGGKGKRDYLLQHSQLKLNGDLVYQHPEQWSESEVATRTSDLIARITGLWPCPSEVAQPSNAARVGLPPSEAVDAPTWDTTVDPDALESAARLWLALGPLARRAVDILVDLSPSAVSAPDLAITLALDGDEPDVPALLAGLRAAAVSLGRPDPVQSDGGHPSSYSMPSATSATFEAAVSLAASEDFVTKVLGRADKGELPKPKRSVPDHILEVFAGLPPYVELTVAEIKKRSSTGYASNEISSGAVAAALDAGNVPGVEWTPAASPRRARRAQVSEP